MSGVSSTTEATVDNSAVKGGRPECSGTDMATSSITKIMPGSIYRFRFHDLDGFGCAEGEAMNGKRVRVIGVTPETAVDREMYRIEALDGVNQCSAFEEELHAI